MKKRRAKQAAHERRKSRRVQFAIRQRNRRRAADRPVRANKRWDGITLVAPAWFVIAGANSATTDVHVGLFFEFLQRIRSADGSSLCIDMRGVRRMVADATLLFKAELSKLTELRQVVLTAVAPQSSRTQQVLKQTGLDRLLNLNIGAAPDREDVVHWRIAEGHRDSVDPNILESIMADIEEVTGMASHPVYQGIIESMGNCVEHAYKSHPDVTQPLPVNPGWWVFQQVKDNQLAVMVCDLGIGISRALPLTLSGEPGLLRKLMHLARRARGADNRALLAAMEYGRSSTGEHQRGKGMRNAHKVVDDMGEGEFAAFSYRGCYLYRRDPSGRVSIRTLKLKSSINGTILRWRLPLSQKAQEAMA